MMNGRRLLGLLPLLAVVLTADAVAGQATKPTALAAVEGILNGEDDARAWSALAGALGDGSLTAMAGLPRPSQLIASAVADSLTVDVRPAIVVSGVEEAGPEDVTRLLNLVLYGPAALADRLPPEWVAWVGAWQPDSTTIVALLAILGLVGLLIASRMVVSASRALSHSRHQQVVAPRRVVSRRPRLGRRRARPISRDAERLEARLRARRVA